MRRDLLVAAALAALVPGAARAAEAQRSTFGVLPDGRQVPAVTLHNAHGMSATVIAYGAILQSVTVPDRQGRRANVVLGYATLAEYVAHPQFFGATAGRYANRIAGGRFTLDGRTYKVPTGGSANALHGGLVGFDKLLWTVVDVRSGPTASVTLRLVSPDGDQGFPGTLTVTATYSLDEADRLRVDYRATSDRPTIVNLTNHSYWDLAGEGSGHAQDALITIPVSTYLPTDRGGIPTGERRPVAGGPFDFRRQHAVAERVRDDDPQIAAPRGYDRNWVFGTAITPEPRLMARALDPASGRGMELWSNQPGLQFYSGNGLDGSIAGTSGHLYRQGDGIAFEPELPPDTPNQPSLGSARLDPGQTYRNVIEYRFFVDRPMQSVSAHP